MTHTRIVDGKPTTRGRLWLSGLSLIGGGTFWLSLFLLLPLVGLTILAFASRGDYGEIIWSFSLDNIWRLFGKTEFGWTADNAWIAMRTLVLAGVTTLLSLAIAFPLTFWIANRPRHARSLWMALIMVPTCTNLVIRTYAWQLILSNHAPPAWLLGALGLVDPGTALYPSAGAVYLGMVSCMLPFAVLPLYTSVERVDWSIVEAASDLYSGRWRTFRHGILPQVMPGLLAACILTLIPSLGMYVVSDLLGGAKFMLIGNYMQNQMSAAQDLPMGAMVGLFLIIASLIAVGLLYRVGGVTRGGIR